MICGKVTYPSRAEAVNSINGQNADKRTRSKRQVKTAYFCDECKGWHLASNRKKPVPQAPPKAEIDTESRRKRKGIEQPLHIKDFTFKTVSEEMRDGRFTNEINL